MAEAAPKYKRVLLKMSGEVLMGDREYGIDPVTLDRIANDIKQAVDIGVQVCIVVGAGNIFRGVSGAAKGLERVTGDYIGMLGTVMNALALQSALEKIDVPTRVQSAIPMQAVCEPFVRRRALRHMEKGRVVIFAAGVGSPFFTTDTPAALRANEMGCDALVKGTKVDGVYSADPMKDPSATHFKNLTYMEVLTKDLKVMDATAISLARENNIPVIIFSIKKPGAFAELMQGRGECTIVMDKKEARNG
ncbi:MAG TPA: UMP kinase, partial [Alphaproteobacteria bacterium]